MNLHPTNSNNSGKLAVPLRSVHNLSISSLNSGVPPHFVPYHRTRSSTGIPRLSRTTTNTDANSNINEDQSLRSIDKTQTAKPSVTNVDKLWTQIDVLDDVKDMSYEAKVKGSFFNDKLNGELVRLKELQNKLLETVAMQHFNNTNSTQRQHSKPLSRLTTRSVHTDDIRPATGPDMPDAKLQQDKLNDFFDSDGTKKPEDILHKKQGFDEVKIYIEDIRKDLQVVGESMKRFDETTREIW